MLLTFAAWACEASLSTLRADLAAADAVRVRADIPCLTERVTPEDAAAVGALLGPMGTGGTAVAPPDAGDVWFDGVISATRPNRGTLFQQTDPSGGLVQSAWLVPSDVMPEYVDVRNVKQRGKLGPGAIIFGSTGAAAFLSGVALAATGADVCGRSGECTQRDVGLGLIGGGALLLVGGVVAIRVGF